MSTILPLFQEDSATAKVQAIYLVNKFYINSSEVTRTTTGAELVAEIANFVALPAPTIEDLATLQTSIVTFKATLTNADGSNDFTSVPLAIFNAVDNLQKVVENEYTVNLIGDEYVLNTRSQTIIGGINDLLGILGTNGSSTNFPNGEQTVAGALAYIDGKTNYIDFSTVNQTVVGSTNELVKNLGANASNFTSSLTNFTNGYVPQNVVSALNYEEGQILAIQIRLDNLDLNSKTITIINPHIYSCSYNTNSDSYAIESIIASIDNNLYSIDYARTICAEWALSTNDHYLTPYNDPTTCSDFADIGTANAACNSYIQYTYVTNSI